MSRTSSGSFTHLKPGRPVDRAAALAALADVEKEPLRRVNFEVNEARHRKLKIAAALAGKSVKGFLTDFIDSLPDPERTP